MIGNKSLDSSDAKSLLRSLEEETERLGIPVVSGYAEQLKCGNFIIAIIDNTKNVGASIRKVEYLKNVILATLKSDQKIVLAYKEYSNPNVRRALNDIFIEIANRYEDRFEIEPVYPTDDLREVVTDLFEAYKDTTEVLFYKDENDGTLHKVYKRYKHATTVIIVADFIDALHILHTIKRDIVKEIIIKKEDTQKWEIINKADAAKICVVMPYQDDLRGAKRE